MRLPVVILLFSVALLSREGMAQTWQVDGNLKYRFVNAAYPEQSIFRDFAGSNAADHSVSTRVNLTSDFDQWSAEASYQLAGITGDTIEYTRDLQGGPLFQSPLQNDDNRLLDLTHTLSEGGSHAFTQRLDRFSVGYQGDRNVVKLGRQAVSWGNGLIYTPMDFFNPFDPTAIDTEYKTGDDMLYAQHLFKNGDDVQLVWVARRNQNKQTSSDVNSLALKYHGFLGTTEFDLLVAEHYRDTVVGLGGSLSVGGSVVRGDWVVSDTDEGRFNNVVANVSYSWNAWNKNITGSLEYFHNDFGIQGDALSLASLNAEPELLNRVGRGELFTLGRDYITGSAVVEMAPLWLLTPNVFYNLSDNSALTQLVSQHDLTQNTQLVVALSVPIGPKGTEYGGFSVNNSTGVEEKFSSSRWSVYAQLAWYY